MTSEEDSLTNLQLLIVNLFTVSETDNLYLLLGNNNCTSIEITSETSPIVAISNVDMERDAVCPITVNETTCENTVAICGLRDIHISPFFHTCGNLHEPSKYSVHFGNATKRLNGTRLDFYMSRKVYCNQIPQHVTRKYFKSFLIQGNKVVKKFSILLYYNISINNSCSFTCSFICFRRIVVE